LYNPWGFQQPQAVTWAQITQEGFLLQVDGDTIVRAAPEAPTSAGNPLPLTLAELGVDLTTGSNSLFVAPPAFSAQPVNLGQLVAAQIAQTGDDLAHPESASAYAVSRHASVDALELLDYGDSLPELEMFKPVDRWKR